MISLDRLPLVGRIFKRAPAAPNSAASAVEEILAELRPAFRADGGDLTLIRITPDGRVILRAHGSCSGCSASVLTLQGAVSPRLKERLPWVTGVELEE
jgi:Fe-S cluster biogenesis protein NfuA